MLCDIDFHYPHVFGNLDVADIVHHQQEATQSALYVNGQLSSLALYMTLQPEARGNLPIW